MPLSFMLQILMQLTVLMLLEVVLKDIKVSRIIMRKLKGALDYDAQQEAQAHTMLLLDFVRTASVKNDH